MNNAKNCAKTTKCHGNKNLFPILAAKELTILAQFMANNMDI